jgi:hypothetical protein
MRKRATPSGVEQRARGGIRFSRCREPAEPVSAGETVPSQNSRWKDGPPWSRCDEKHGSCGVRNNATSAQKRGAVGELTR